MAASPTAPLEDQTEALAATHRLKLKPPTYDGNYSTFEEWKYKFTAYMGLMDPFYPNILRRAATSTQRLTEADLRGAAQNMEEADRWVQLDNNLKYILVNVTTGAAATVCRQYQHEMGLETYRQLSNRFAIPLGTRSIGYLTKPLLKPTFDSNNFEESFSNWEFELSRYERDNNTTLPDQIKIAVLMNETSGPLQQHLHLNAGATPTYVEVRGNNHGILQSHHSPQQATPATWDIQRLNTRPRRTGTYGHWSCQQRIQRKVQQRKRKEAQQRKRKEQEQQRQRIWLRIQQRQRKDWARNAAQRIQQQRRVHRQRQRQANRKRKGVPTQGCYRCGQSGLIARDCRVAVHNLNEVTTNT